MLWILKEFPINNQFTPSSSGLCYIMWKECISNYLCVLSCISFMCRCWVWSKRQVWLACHVEFIIQIWLKAMRWNFAQTYKYISTLSEKMAEIWLSIFFYLQVCYHLLFDRTPCINLFLFYRLFKNKRKRKTYCIVTKKQKNS